MSAGLVPVTDLGVDSSSSYKEISSRSSRRHTQFGDKLQKLVETKLSTAEGIPGIAENIYQVIKEKISFVWKDLAEEGVVRISPSEESGGDDQIRPTLVGLQVLIECIIALELGVSIHSFEGVIHTPNIPKPLGLSPEATTIPSGYVTAEVAQDPVRAGTVMGRIHSLREILNKQGTLHAVHLNEPSGNALIEFEKVKALYPNLVDHVLKVPDVVAQVTSEAKAMTPSVSHESETSWTEGESNDVLPAPSPVEKLEAELSAFSGATYVFRERLRNGQPGETFVFSIAIPQSDRSVNGTCSVWLDAITNPEINQRFEAVDRFLIDRGIKLNWA